MQYRKFTQFFDRHRERSAPLALATVYRTSGSTYSKAGAHMLIDADGVFRGMLSGGCLEGDLAIRAQRVIESGSPQRALYDLAGDDELWGLGVGCEGAMHVFLQPLGKATGYEPFASIMRVTNGSSPAALALVVQSDGDVVAEGASLLLSGGEPVANGMPAALAERLHPLLAEARITPVAALKDIDVNGETAAVFVTTLNPRPRLLVLGAGLDAEPVVRFAAELGWRATVVDHRPAYVDGNDFAHAEATVCCDADEVASHVDLDAFDVAIVMSHHLASDRSYLRQLASSRIGYVGLLGPAARRDRLMSELGEQGAPLAERLRGPAGLDLGGRGPAAIALAIVAEMQQSLAEAGLSRRPGAQAENSG
jgi:xanthine/CO dehydrogenase XdhC/CoxF family maturation factor